MKVWILKAIIQKFISFLPYPHKFNYIFQKYVTKGVYLTDEYFYDRLGHAKDHLDAFYLYSQKKKLSVCLELGTGWYPVVPISFFLSGVKKTYSVDISMLTSRDRIFTTIDQFKKAYDRGILTEYLPELNEKCYQQLLELRANTSLDLNSMLQMLNMEYLIGDARKLNLPDSSVDLVNSNNTFEHIPPDILSGILKEFSRVTDQEKGVMSHFIDMSDHFAHFDKSITIYNFLKFSDRQWKIIDNSIQPQNRLRIYDYEKIYSDLSIPISKISYRKGNLDELRSVSLNNKYSNAPIEEVAKSHCHFITKF